MNIDRMLAKISGDQFAEWMAYARLEPFGEERGDLRMAILAATMVNTHIDPDKSSPVEPKDFLPNFDGDIEESDPAIVAQKIDLYFSMLAAA